jgi:ubiquinol-cytochrome c reductase cytochrome c1 subunit
MRIFKLLAVAASSIGLAMSAHAAGGAKHPHPPESGWTFEGTLGYFDQGQVQRGYKVYRNVCAACHGMDLLKFRNLGEKGGPFYDKDYPNANDNPIVKQLAADAAEVDIINQEDGSDDTRTRLPSDPFPNPYLNDAQGRYANNGALPPDLSVITKARHGGASYIYSLLVGYPSAEEMEKKYSKLTVPAGQYYNPYFAGDVTPNWSGDPRPRHGDGSEHDKYMLPKGGMLAMAPPLAEGIVEYDDGTEATVEQLAEDVSAFLAWAGEPKAQTRKQLGLSVMIYLLILTVLVYLSYKQLWRNIEH